MNNRLGLFREFIKGTARRPERRKLYTDQIYPYPHNYFDKKFPTQICYRETWPILKRNILLNKEGLWMFRAFWFIWFSQFFRDPGVIFGHHDPPDPRKWTDAELGIPPEEYGSYEEWVKRYDEEDV